MLTIFDGGAISGIIDGISADLAASAALAGSSAAAAGQFEVDLAALYNHHADVVRLYDQVTAKLKDIKSGHDWADIFRTSSDIEGVSDSLSATLDTALGTGSSGSSMTEGIATVAGGIAKYANDIATVYTSYVNADSAGASDLSAASNPDAAGVSLPGSN